MLELPLTHSCFLLRTHNEPVEKALFLTLPNSPRGTGVNDFPLDYLFRWFSFFRHASEAGFTRFLCPSGHYRSVLPDLPDIVNHRVEQPLRIYLALPTEREPTQSYGRADVAEDRLCDPQTSAVVQPAFPGVDLSFHLLGECLRRLWGSTLEEMHLPWGLLVRPLQTLLPQAARPTIPLGSHEADRLVPPDLEIAVLQV